MKYCEHCGRELMDNAVICPGCGCALSTMEEDKPNVGLNVLSVFIPIVGLVLYCVWNSKTPKKAKSVGLCALISFIVGVVFWIVFYAIIIGVATAQM